MKIGGRNLGTIIRALGREDQYASIFNSLQVYDYPLKRNWQYLSRTGVFPCSIVLNTPIGRTTFQLFTNDDLITVNEIFCRKDYGDDRRAKIVVDFGANIGLSAGYFLTRNKHSFVYAVEPLRPNIAKLQSNLSIFVGRFHVGQYAVGVLTGDVEFSHEPTGRYGGIASKQDLPQRMIVPCRDANEVLEDILARHDYIDILKIDVENFESEILLHLNSSVLARIRTIYAECEVWTNELPGFKLSKRGIIARLENIAI